MTVREVRNTGLKAGMHIKIDGSLRTVKRIFPGTFDIAIVEFSNGDRTTVSLRTSSTVVTVN
jgi:hypothetical protein